MAKKTVIGEITVQKQKYPLSVDENGVFQVKIGEIELHADSKADLEKKASREVSIQRVEYKIPVILHMGGRGLFGKGGGDYVRATLRGKNARTQAWLFTFDNGAKDSLEYPTIAARGEWLTDAQVAELNRLATVAQAAAEAQTEYLYSCIPLRPEEMRSKHRQHVDVPSAHQLLAEAQEKALAKEAGNASA